MCFVLFKTESQNKKEQQKQAENSIKKKAFLKIGPRTAEQSRLGNGDLN